MRFSIVLSLLSVAVLSSALPTLNMDMRRGITELGAEMHLRREIASDNADLELTADMAIRREMDSDATELTAEMAVRGEIASDFDGAELTAEMAIRR
ncbi:hypothetical protein FB451DRAFT_1392852 [Mycena latifolia]|nr:hypothetical protein FB451DRAFT_1392852 [Mycena latifolia]